MITIERTSFSKKTDKLILFVSIGLFVISLALPCFHTENDGNDAAEGFMPLLIGFFGPFSCPVWFSWVANPFMLFSWVFFNKKIRRSLILSFFAFSFCLSFLFFDSIKMGDTDNYTRITSRELGYWVWTVGAFVLFIGNTTRYIIEKRAAT